jgi:hypothetical protein
MSSIMRNAFWWMLETANHIQLNKAVLQRYEAQIKCAE